MLPREKIHQSGTETLTDHELLRVLLGTAPGGVDRLATDLIARFGGLRGVVRARPEELRSVCGIGDSRAALLMAIGEIAMRLWRGESAGVVVGGAQDAYRLFSDLALEDQEVLAGAFLDVKNRVIRRRPIFRGTADASLARPREILREALRVGAARLVVAHNHPSGEPEPSDEDAEFTARLEAAGRAVGIPLVDHVIVGSNGRYFSFREAKLIASPRPGRGKTPDCP